MCKLRDNPQARNPKSRCLNPEPKSLSSAGEERDLEAADSVEVRLQELGGQVGEFEAQLQSERSLLFVLSIVQKTHLRK